MHRRVILLARLGIAVAERHMNCAAHLLVKKGVFGAAIHTRIVSEGKFTQITRPGIQIQHAFEVRLALAGARFNDFAILEDQPHALDSATLKGGGNLEVDGAIRAILHRSCEELAARKVAFSVAVDKHPSLDREGQISPLTQDAHTLTTCQPVHQPLLLARNLIPTYHRIGVVKKTDIEDKLLK